jgi:hypothetical protein
MPKQVNGEVDMKYRDLGELLSCPDYNQKYAQAKATRTCINCEKPVKDFRDASCELEYKISALCQSCQTMLLQEK